MTFSPVLQAEYLRPKVVIHKTAYRLLTTIVMAGVHCPKSDHNLLVQPFELNAPHLKYDPEIIVRFFVIITPEAVFTFFHDIQTGTIS